MEILNNEIELTTAIIMLIAVVLTFWIGWGLGFLSGVRSSSFKSKEKIITKEDIQKIKRKIKETELPSK